MTLLQTEPLRWLTDYSDLVADFASQFIDEYDLQLIEGGGDRQAELLTQISGYESDLLQFLQTNPLDALFVSLSEDLERRRKEPQWLDRLRANRYFWANTVEVLVTTLNNIARSGLADLDEYKVMQAASKYFRRCLGNDVSAECDGLSTHEDSKGYVYCDSCWKLLNQTVAAIDQWRITVE